VRTCELQIEKVTRASWPPTEALCGERRHVLSELFHPALALAVIRGPNDLNTMGDICDVDDLLGRMVACRDCASGGWHAHLFVVGQIDHQNVRPSGLLLERGRTRQPDTCGRRRGCVVAWDAIARLAEGYTKEQADLLYLRVVAHELGHLFNLGHDELPSLMTPLQWFQRRRGYPENICFCLSPAQLEWLSRGPIDEVCPGGRLFHGEGGRRAFPRNGTAVNG
jgi:hypothetical protein